MLLRPNFRPLSQITVDLQRNRHTGKRYDDNLCFFRCVALHHSNVKNSGHLERDTQHFLHRFREGVGNQNVNGVTLDDLGEAERIFEMNIQVYSLIPRETVESGEEEEAEQLPGGQVRAELIRRSHRRFPTTLYLNLYGNHFSYI